MSNFVIVGGSKGIGAAICEQLLSQGHEVTCISRSAPNHSGKSIILDVLNEDLGSDHLPNDIQGLAYCIGSINLKGFKTLKEEQYLEDFKINVLGAIKVIKSVLPKMKVGGSILLFSTVAVKLGMPFHASVAIAKGAIEGLTVSLAAELAPNIRVNAIAPSLTDTSLASALLNNDEKRQRSAAMHPLKKYGQPEDIAKLASLLLSEDGAWITGQIIAVDGGLSTLKSA